MEYKKAQIMNAYRGWAAMLVFVFIGSLQGESIYIAQTSQGGNTGADCANAHAAAWFNAVGNWGSGAGQIGAGDTVRLCGTFTSALRVQASGTAGTPILVHFEPGAKISLPNCGGGGCLNTANRSHIIIDGGPPCGWINGEVVPCNGTIENTNTSLEGSTFGIVGDKCSDCEFKNLHLANISSASGDQRGIQNLTGTPSGHTFKIHNNVAHGIKGSAFVYVPGEQNDNGFQVYNNYVYDINSSVDISNNNNGTMTAAAIHDNRFSSTAFADAAGCPGHHNSLHAFAKPGPNGGTNSGIDYYNNLIDGYWGNCATSGVFFEGGEYGANSNVRVFNNIFKMTYDQMNNGIISLNGVGPLAFYNNTVLGTRQPGDVCIGVSGIGASISLENNIISNCNTLVAINFGSGATAAALTAWDYNIYTGGGTFTDQSVPVWYEGANAFALWSAAMNVDTHSLSYAASSSIKVDSAGFLEDGSPAIGMGENLTGLGIEALNYDLAGNPRPATGAWDAGAYQYAPDHISYGGRYNAAHFSVVPVVPNPVRADILYHYLRIYKGLKVYSLSGNRVAITSLTKEGVYFIHDGMNPELQKVAIVK